MEDGRPFLGKEKVKVKGKAKEKEKNKEKAKAKEKTIPYVRCKVWCEAIRK